MKIEDIAQAQGKIVEKHPEEMTSITENPSPGATLDTAEILATFSNICCKRPISSLESILCNDSEEQRNSQKRLKLDSSDKTPPPLKYSPFVVEPFEEEAPLTKNKNATNSGSASSIQDKDLYMRLTFPEKLMEMLSRKEFSDSICWLPHGKSFTIVDPEKFNSQVLPLFFKRCKHKSFTRKLYRWGFRLITKGPETNSYFNENFLRDSADQITKMFCHYSSKELQARCDYEYAQKQSTCTSQSQTASGPPTQSISQSQSYLSSLQNSSLVQNSVTSALSIPPRTNAALTSPNPSTNLDSSPQDLSSLHSAIIAILDPSSRSSLPVFPCTQNMIQPRTTSQNLNSGVNLSTFLANTNVQKQQTILQIAQLQRQELEAKLRAEIETSIIAHFAISTQQLLDRLGHRYHQPFPYDPIFPS